MPKLLLFDVDGTLLLTGRAGLRAMVRTFRELFGLDDPFAGVAMAGRTDTFLLSEALRAVGLADDDATHARFRDVYLRILSEEIEQPGTGHKGLMPGVRPLLDALDGPANRFRQGYGGLAEAQSAEAEAGPHASAGPHAGAGLHAGAGSHVQLALLTGNYREAARIKLSYFGVWHFFPWGVFGDESPDRNMLAKLARERAATELPTSTSDITIVGDTPFDVECARAIGARAVGVGTGGHSTFELRDAGADIVFEDLSDTKAVLDALL